VQYTTISCDCPPHIHVMCVCTLGMNHQGRLVCLDCLSLQL